MAEQNTLRQADNQVIIEGILVEKRLEQKANNEGKEYITGELDIEVRENEVHTVRVFSNKLKQDGSENGIYKGLVTVDEEYKSIASHGREEADKVRITQGQVGINDYYGQDGMLRTFPQLSTNFVNRLAASDEFNPRAEFEVEIFVKSIVPEVKNDEETGRVKVNGIIPLYGGKVAPFEFMVSEEGSEYVSDNYEVASTVKVYGDIINYKETKKTEQAVAFGKPKEKITYNTVREYLITGGSEPYDEDDAKAYSIESIQQAMVERETYLTELKVKSEKPKKEEKKGGFGSKGSSSTKSDKPKKPTPDLPF